MKMHRTFNTVGIVGYGAFGKLIAHHLFPHFDINVYDPAIAAEDNPILDRIKVVNLRSAASCDIIVLAVPVARMEDVIRDLLPHLTADTIVSFRSKACWPMSSWMPIGTVRKSMDLWSSPA